LLEVRPSNEKALALYRHFGFQQIGVRRGYYPAEQGREDALVLTHSLVEVKA
jgi:ribosomal protein S18 acetylase RimI-like enzyme